MAKKKNDRETLYIVLIIHSKMTNKAHCSDVFRKLKIIYANYMDNSTEVGNICEQINIFTEEAGTFILAFSTPYR